jgi:hypothetical protein
MPAKEEVMNRTLVAASALLAVGALKAADEIQLQPYPVQGQVIQVLKAFDNPEGALFTPDGKHVLISNSAELGDKEKGFRFVDKAGYISKLEVQTDGTLKMVNEQLLSGLTGPVGMTVSTVATSKFPKGTFFVCTVAAPLISKDGADIKDAARIDPKMIAFNADGKILGEIKMGQGSAFAKASGATATLPNANSFDKEGNLYVADSGIGGASFDPPLKTNGGIYMVPITSLDQLAEGKDAPIKFIGMGDGAPDGVEVALDGSIHTNTVGAAAGMQDPAKGGMYRLTQEDFTSGKLPAPIQSGLGALDGLAFIGDLRFDTEITKTQSVIVTPAGGKPMLLTLDQDLKLAGPADIAVNQRADGSYLLVIPELSANAPNTKQDAVTIVRLPADFAKTLK